jgi:hypothetical protein
MKGKIIAVILSVVALQATLSCVGKFMDSTKADIDARHARITSVR